MTDWFTSDTHFNHANIITYCNRPFKDINEMNEKLIANWNEVVDREDTVYHLGDFGFGDIEKIFIRLNGFIVLLQGSHDKDLTLFRKEMILSQVIEKQMVVMCHYAMRTWAKSHFNSWHLYGHSHGHLEPLGKSFDCGVDTCYGKNHIPFTPYSMNEVKSIMKSLPDNFNLIK